MDPTCIRYRRFMAFWLISSSSELKHIFYHINRVGHSYRPGVSRKLTQSNSSRWPDQLTLDFVSRKLTPGLLVLRTKVFRSLIACKTFYRPTSAKSFSYLALLAMQNYRRAFQNTISVWTTYEIDPYHGTPLCRFRLSPCSHLDRELR